jgi:hypothetical protein
MAALAAGMERTMRSGELACVAWRDGRADKCAALEKL